ncbi:hypothetical protein Tco_0299900 [Tanacetum coccineum]
MLKAGTKQRETVALKARLHGRESGAGFERCKRLTKKACEGTYMEFVVGEVNKKGLDLQVFPKAYEERLNEAGAAGSIPVDLSIRLQLE